MEIMMTNLPSSICIWDITKVLLTGLLNFVYYIWQMGKKKKGKKKKPPKPTKNPTQNRKELLFYNLFHLPGQDNLLL